MRLMIAAIGKTRSGPLSDLSADYLARAQRDGRNLGFTGPDLMEFEAPRGLSGAKRQTSESALLMGAAPPSANLIRLDERGKAYTSEDFAALLGKWRDEGVNTAAFFIGGADGYDKVLREKAPFSISFGAATWPHMLVRVMLAEQIYRAMTILSGHPYHRS
ncbi:MAG: ribosomal RNA large subunit methyltransferase H [Hyphococcus sp.]|nr:MAG: ribosomal RNA large subunit methyltransferase H [Marinicaulis sp.]